MTMGQSLCFVQYHSQRQSLDHDQKLEYKQLLQLEQRLKHPDIPQPTKGLEGMKVAHQILKQQNSTGILIGGIAEAVWSRKRTVEELYQHKDVDVMVLNDSSDIDRFEGGIDWWLPYEARLKVSNDFSVEIGNKKWWQNGNGVILNFGLEQTYQLPPGLYIPNPDWLTNMRLCEAEINFDYTNKGVGIDPEVLDKYRTHIESRMNTKLPSYLSKLFASHILSDDYGAEWRSLEAITLTIQNSKTIDAINRIPETLADIANDEDLF